MNQKLPDVRKLLKQALVFHQQGLLKDAKRLYEEALKVVPDHFDALHLLGVIAFQMANNPEAARLISRALQINPLNPTALLNYGNALKALKHHEEALASYDKAIAIKPDYANALSNRGVALKELKRHEEALISYDRALAIKPDYADAHYNRGNVLQELRRQEEALASYDKVLIIKQDDIDTLTGRGNVLAKLKRYEEAIASYDNVLAIKPDDADAHYNRGNVLQELKRHEKALASYDKALAIKPDYADAHYSRGNVLQELQRYGEALASYDKVLIIKQDDIDTLTGRGNVLAKLKRYGEALASYDKAITINPCDAEAHYNRGNALQELKRYEEALASYAKAIATRPGDAKIHFNESICRLLVGDFARGWAKYEWRWQDEQFKKSRRNFPQPLWLGEQPLLGKTILLHDEQGFGDTLQFVRYIKDVATLGANVLLAVKPPLQPLLKDMGGVSQLVRQGEWLMPFDYYCPLLSLPLAFKTELDTIPSKIPYLQSNSELLVQWQARLRNKHFPRVGIAWSGSELHKNDRSRSIPLKKMALLASSNISLISLQKEVRAEDQDILDAHNEILHFGEELKDFADTAALIDCLDLIVSVDTSVAHLAGALGKPVWILLPYNPDWRWLLDREDSPWYPTARLFRQPGMGDWDSVIQRVVQEMSSLVSPAA